jgi:hypothetical protein
VCYNDTVSETEVAKVTTNWQTATPPEVDEKLAELWEAANRERATIEGLRVSLHQLMDIRAEYVGRRRVYKHSLSEIVEMARSFEPKPWDQDRKARYLDGVGDATARLEAVRAEAAPLEARFEEKPWSRFFLVTNANGHIHSSMHCSTCRISTQFAWLPTLSGLTEKDAVEAHGPLLCSVCFPSAPVEWTVGHVKDTSDRCPGSGTSDFDPKTYRQGYKSGRARCNHCGEYQTVTSAHNLRAHKPSKEKS